MGNPKHVRLINEVSAVVETGSAATPARAGEPVALPGVAGKPAADWDRIFGESGFVISGSNRDETTGVPYVEDRSYELGSVTYDARFATNGKSVQCNLLLPEGKELRNPDDLIPFLGSNVVFKEREKAGNAVV